MAERGKRTNSLPLPSHPSPVICRRGLSPHPPFLSFSPAFRHLPPTADLITCYIYQRWRCYFGLETLVADMERLRYSESGRRRRRTRRLLLTRWRRACLSRDRPVTGAGAGEAAAAPLCSKTQLWEKRRKREKKKPTPTYTYRNGPPRAHKEVRACLRACTAGMDRCHPYLDVIYDGSSIEATAIWEMMSILI